MLYGTLLYLPRGDDVLMVKKGIRPNDPNSGYYALPGGKLEGDERKTFRGRIERAVKEVKQETGLIVLDAMPRGAILFDNSERIFDNWSNPENYFVYVFFAEHYSGRLKGSKEGVPLWVPKKEILGLPKNPGDVRMYEWINNGRYFKGIIKHKGKVLDEVGTSVRYFGSH